MGNWIDTLLNKLGLLWPMTKLEPWQEGLFIWYVPKPLQKWKKLDATIRKPVGPGVHFTPWYFSTIKRRDTRLDWLDLQVQSITTRDLHNISFSCNIGYRIVDIRKAIGDVQHLGASLEATSRNHLARRVRSYEFTELIAKQDDLERSLRGTLETRARQWGITIEDVGFTDMTESTTSRVLGDAVLHVSADVSTSTKAKDDANADEE